MPRNMGSVRLIPIYLIDQGGVRCSKHTNGVAEVRSSECSYRHLHRCTAEKTWRSVPPYHWRTLWLVAGHDEGLERGLVYEGHGEQRRGQQSTVRAYVKTGNAFQAAELGGEFQA